jgi:hypothetical protein
VRDGIARGVGVIGLCGVGLIHTIDAPGHFVGGPDTYLGVMYIGLILSCLALAAALIVRGDRRVWAAAAGLMGAVTLGFVLSRTTGLPGDSGDIGNWGEALGIASLFVEGSMMALCAAVLSLRIEAPETPATLAAVDRGVSSMTLRPLQADPVR